MSILLTYYIIMLTYLPTVGIMYNTTVELIFILFCGDVFCELEHAHKTADVPQRKGDILCGANDTHHSRHPGGRLRQIYHYYNRFLIKYTI